MTTELHGRKIGFPQARSFADIFASAEPYNAKAPPLAVVESWECGTWSDKQRQTRTEIGGYCAIDGQTERRSLSVSVKPEVLEWIKANMLMGPHERITFAVHVWDDGRALVAANYSQISGGSYLAIIDVATVPGMPTPAEIMAAKRADYMEKRLTHQAYYEWLSAFIGLGYGLIPFSAERVNASKDEHLNDLPLASWDFMHGAVKGYAARKRLPWSLSDTVCCLKALARKRQAENT